MDYPMTPGEYYTTEHGGLYRCLRAYQRGAKMVDERDGRVFKAIHIYALGETREGPDSMTVIWWDKERTVGYEI